MDPSRKILAPKSKSRISKRCAATAPASAPAKFKASPKDLVPLVAECLAGSTSCQLRKQQQAVYCKVEKFSTNTYFITCDLSDQSTKPVPMPKASKRERIPEADSEEDDCEGEESDDDLTDSDEEREVVIRNARKRLEQLLAETTSLVDELEKMENDVQRLQDEKIALLEQLLSCEGVAVNHTPLLQPLPRKIKLLKIKF